MSTRVSFVLMTAVVFSSVVSIVARADGEEEKKKPEPSVKAYLGGLTNDEIDKYAKEVKSIIKDWKKRAEKEMGALVLKTNDIGRAYEIIILAKEDSVKAKKITRVLNSLEALPTMGDVAALRALLDTTTKRPSSAKALALVLLQAADQHFLSEVEHKAIEELINRGSKDSFKLAMERIEDGESEFFQ